MEVYQTACNISDLVWEIVVSWNQFSKDTVGKQLVNASDRVASNIAEGSGSFIDNHRFLKISRGSLFETKHWLVRAHKRKLFVDKQYEDLRKLVDELIPRLSAFMAYVKKKSKK